MERLLKISSWFAVIIGALTILDGFSAYSGEEASYAFLGGLIFAGQGFIALSYIKEIEKYGQARQEAIKRKE
ncbi:MAG: hypothetical protein WCX46_04290 [Candidatus Paceibacterota bacterium]